MVSIRFVVSFKAKWGFEPELSKSGSECLSMLAPHSRWCGESRGQGSYLNTLLARVHQGWALLEKGSQRWIFGWIYKDLVGSTILMWIYMQVICTMHMNNFLFLNVLLYSECDFSILVYVQCFQSFNIAVLIRRFIFSNCSTPYDRDGWIYSVLFLHVTQLYSILCLPLPGLWLF